MTPRLTRRPPGQDAARNPPGLGVNGPTGAASASPCRDVTPDRGLTPEVGRLRFPLEVRESSGSGFTTGVGFVSSRTAADGRVSLTPGAGAAVAARISAAAARAVRATESSPSEPSLSSAPASLKCLWASS